MTLVNVEGKMGGGDSMQCCCKTLTYDIKSVLGDHVKCVGMLAIQVTFPLDCCHIVSHLSVEKIMFDIRRQLPPTHTNTPLPMPPHLKETYSDPFRNKNILNTIQNNIKQIIITVCASL